MTYAEVRSPVTGTPGSASFIRDLPDDVDEAWEILRRRTEVPDRTELTPKLIARAWQWMLQEFGSGADLEEITVGQLVELYLDS